VKSASKSQRQFKMPVKAKNEDNEDIDDIWGVEEEDEGD